MADKEVSDVVKREARRSRIIEKLKKSKKDQKRKVRGKGLSQSRPASETKPVPPVSDVVKREAGRDKVLQDIRKKRILRDYVDNPKAFHSMEDDADIDFYMYMRNLPEVEKIVEGPEPMEAKSGGQIKKKYGYMGGGKVYGQPRKANYKAG